MSHLSALINRAAAACCALLLALGVLAFASTPALAAGSPDLGLTADGGGQALQGTQATIKLTATSPAGAPQGYNLSYRAVLPADIGYVAGSSSPNVELQVIANQPSAGQTTLIWSNVSDIGPNSSQTLSFKVTHVPATYPIGSTFSIDGGAYVQTDPRLVPKFTAAGAPDPASYTGSATGTSITKIAAVEIEKSEPSPEHELLRGVHDHQTTYTLTYRNNAVLDTQNIVVDDYLPAGLEFLGCGGPGTDHTTDAPTNPGSADEYPGSGPIIVPAVPGCVTPTLVETMSGDPDGAGPLPTGVYTHVRWQPAATLTPGQTGTITYAAAIPIRENTMTWSGGSAPATTGAQTANLDNNSGPETTDEQPLLNGAEVSGQYGGSLPVSDSDTLTVTAEDLRLLKSVSSNALQQGTTRTWTLKIDTSEYRSADGLTVTDTVPDGLCPLGPVNYETTPPAANGECDPTGANPSIPYTSVVENANGTFTVTWDAIALGSLTSNDSLTLTFPTKTRTNYQENFQDAGAILAGDSVKNTVNIDGTAHRICTGGATPEDCTAPAVPIAGDGPSSQNVTDASQAGLQATLPALTKKVAQTSSNCSSDTYVTTKPSYRPGDRVCWDVQIDYPTALDTDEARIDDFLPTYDLFDTGLGTSGQIIAGDDTMPTTSFDNSGAVPGPGGTLQWAPGTATVTPSQRLHRQFATTVGLPLASAAAPSTDGDVVGNLFKTTVENTAGVTTSLRDQADYTLTKPELAITKRIVQLNGGAVGPTQNQSVNGGDTVRFALTITNTGSLAADDVELWDELPTQYSCTTDVTFPVAPPAPAGQGTCASASRITWGSGVAVGPTVPAGGAVTLYYDVTVPNDVFQPGETATNNVGIRTFQTPTNVGGQFVYYPVNNIDPSVEAQANVPQARDAATLTGDPVTMTKARTSPSDGANNGTAQATIGEIVSYDVRATIQPHLTVNNAVISDPSLDLVTRFPLVSGSVDGTLNGGPLPGGFSVGLDGSGKPAITFPASYSTGGAAETFSLTFQVKVGDVAANAAGGTFSNRGRIVYDNPNAAGSTTRQSSSVSTTIVEPRIGITKSNNAGGPISGGQIVTYTLALTNGPGSGSPVSRAHDTVVVDQVPSGLTPLDATDTPVADGGSTGGATPATWNQAARTLTWQPTTAGGSVNDPLEPGGSQSLSYKVQVNNPPTGGAASTNTVDVTTTSMAGSVPGERTGTIGTTSRYWARATNTLTVAGATVTKTASPATATVGTQVTYTVDATIPANVQLFDTTVIDTLPANIDFDAHVSQTCTSGCPPNISVQTYTTATGASTQTVAWDLGDIAASTNARVVRLVYTGHVRATNRGSGSNVVGGDTSTNTVRIYSNLADNGTPFDPAVIPSPGSFDITSAPATGAVTVREPSVSMAKAVRVNGSGAWSSTPVNVVDGNTLEYRIVVTNTSPTDGTGWPLYDVTVDDQPDSELTNVNVATAASWTISDNWSAGDPDIQWQIPGPIAPGASVTLTYTADLVAVTSLTNLQSIDNTAKLPSSYAVPESERTTNPTWNYRTYTAADSSARAIFHSPQLAIAKTVGAGCSGESAPAQVLQPFTWCVTVSNTSTVAGATNLKVTDTLPADWEYEATSAVFSGTGGGAIEPTIAVNASGDVLTWDTSLDLAAGASRTLIFRAVPQPASATSIGTGAGNPHINRASATVENTANHAADASGPFAAGPDTAQAILSVPSLTIAKTPDGGSTAAGSTATFTIVVTNTGSVPARNVVVTDAMPANTTYTAASATAVFAPATPAPTFTENDGTAPSLRWTISQLEAGQSATITLNLGTDPAASSGTVLTNNSATYSQEVPTPVTDPGDYTLTTSADLAASKSATPNPATAGAGLDYTVGITNLGPSYARSAVLADTLPSTVELDPSAPLDPACSYSSVTRLITCIVGDMPPSGAGSSVSYTIKTIVNVGATGNATNVVTVTSATPDPVPGNNSATRVVPIGSEADLSIVKTTLDSPILNGQTGRFRLAIGNGGPSTATGVTVTDVLAPELDYVSDDSGCTYTAGTRTLSCLLGAVDPGATPQIVVTVRANTAGTFDNTATVTSATPDPTPGDNTSTSNITVDPAADLRISKTAPATVDAGGSLQYTVVVTNDGPNTAVNARFVDTLPGGVVFDSADAGCAASGQTVTCALGDLAAGASETRRITVQVPVALGTKQLLNTATTTSDTTDPSPGNNTDTATTDVGPMADLAVTKSGPAQIDQGANVLWTIVVTNNGPSEATGVTLTDELPSGTVLLTTSTPQGSCSATGMPLSCDLGTIPSGGTVQVLVAASTSPALAGGSFTNPVSVKGNEPDVDPSNNTATWTTAVTTVPFDSADLRVAKTVDGPATIGKPLGYTITVYNAGPAVSTNTNVVDALPAGLTFVSATASQGACAAEGQVVTCQLGTLAVGQSAVVHVQTIPYAFGDLTNSVVVAGDRSDVRPPSNQAFASTSIPKTMTKLTLTKKLVGKTLRAGGKATYKLKVKNTGAVTAINVRTCDQLPSGLTLRSRSGGKLTKGKLCFELDRLVPGKTKTYRVKVRVSKTLRSSKVVNRATTVADNAKRRRAKARNGLTNVGGVRTNGLTG